MHKVDKPWGHEVIWSVTDRYAGKLLCITKGHRLSLQAHEVKDESIYVLSGICGLETVVDGRTRIQHLAPGECAHIPTGTIHRFFGVEEFCTVCMKCADDCPSQSIPYGKKSTQVPTRSNNPGVNKWTINPEQCFKFWIANQTECSNCIRVCPFNQEEGWIHDAVRYLIKRAPMLDRLFLRLHGALGYGKQLDPAAIWDQ